jgi:hypothetical protein
MYTATTAEAGRLAEAWAAVSEHERVGGGPVSAELRALWGVEAGAHPRATVLGAPASSRGYLRLVDSDVEVADELPARRVGPFGFELFSRDVDLVHQRLVRDGTFAALSAPTDYDMSVIGSGIGRSFAARGPGGIWILITTMISVPPPRPLPAVEQLVGPVVNMPIATLAREPAVRLYHEALGIPVRFDGRLADPVVNAVISLPADRAFHCTVFSIGDGQLVEHHVHPPGTLAPPVRPPGRLRPGPAGYAFTVDDLGGAVEAARVAGHEVRGPLPVPDAPYAGRRVACLDGPDGEAVELIEA